MVLFILPLLHSYLMDSRGQGEKRQRHSSILYGKERVDELLEGHVKNCLVAFRMEPYIFKSLASYLRRKELIKDTRLRVEEKLAFFLYMLSHNSSYEDLQLEFKHSGSTFHEYINEFFDIIPALCTRFVEPPLIDEPHPIIATDERFYPYFKNCIGAIDGSHSYPNIGKFKKKSFPLFDLLGELYDAEGTYNFTSIAQPSQIDEDLEDEREVEEVKETDDFEMMNQVQNDDDDLQILEQMDAAHTKEDVDPIEERGRTMAGTGKMPQKKPKKEKPNNSGDVIAGALEKYIELKKRQVDDEAAYLANERGEATKLHDFSITKCMDVLKTMEDVTRIEKIKAFNVFKDVANLEIFINVAADDKETAVMWLRSQMSP